MIPAHSSLPPSPVVEVFVNDLRDEVPVADPVAAGGIVRLLFATALLERGVATALLSDFLPGASLADLAVSSASLLDDGAVGEWFISALDRHGEGIERQFLERGMDAVQSLQPAGCPC